MLFKTGIEVKCTSCGKVIEEEKGRPFRCGDIVDVLCYKCYDKMVPPQSCAEEGCNEKGRWFILDNRMGSDPLDHNSRWYSCDKHICDIAVKGDNRLMLYERYWGDNFYLSEDYE